jgi:hypothetical protein
MSTGKEVISRHVTFNEGWKTSPNPILTPTELLNKGGDDTDSMEVEASGGLDPDHESDAIETIGGLDPPEPEASGGFNPPRAVLAAFNHGATEFTVDSPVPERFKGINTFSDRDMWYAADNKEYDSLVKNNTWTLVPRSSVPVSLRVLPSRTVYRRKFNSDGTVNKCKARFVAKGYGQTQGLDYFETWSPVARITSVRALLALVGAWGWKTRQLDVETAFLHATLNEDVYVEQMEGHTVTTLNGESGLDLVYKLDRSLYGIKQAPRRWFETLTDFLSEFGFKPSSHDPAVQLYRVGDEVNAIMVLWVDDLMIAYKDEKWIKTFIKALESKFPITDLGSILYCIGMHVTHNNDGSIKVTQEKYIDDVLARFNMTDCHTVQTPLITGTTFSLTDSPSEDSDEWKEAKKLPYQSLIGSLMFLVTCTRPDIAYAVNSASRVMTRWSISHWKQAKRILQYLKGTRSLSLKFNGKNNSDELLSAYTDADYAADRDSRRSTTGFVCLLNGGPIAWKSQLQKSVSLSTAEAEYMSLCSCTQEIVYLRNFMTNIGCKQIKPTIIHEDNQACEKLAKNPVISTRSKHIDIRYHYTREVMEQGLITVKYCKTNDMLADVLTKPLSPEAHVKFTNKILWNHSEDLDKN